MIVLHNNAYGCEIFPSPVLPDPKNLGGGKKAFARVGKKIRKNPRPLRTLEGANCLVLIYFSDFLHFFRFFLNDRFFFNLFDMIIFLVWLCARLTFECETQQNFAFLYPLQKMFDIPEKCKLVFE